MYRALKIFIYSFTHNIGLCKFAHKTRQDMNPEEAWRSNCPVLDRMMLEWYPMTLIKKD